MKKQLLILFAFISVLALSQVPQRFNKVVVTGDITSPKFIKTGSTADSVLLGNGSARAISTIKTDTVSLSNRINAKAAGNGTANGTNTGDETLTSIKTKLGAATSVSDGYLKYQDFALLHTPTTVTAANGLSISGQNISLQDASLTQSGALTFNDWNTFNSKEPSFSKNTGFNKNFGTTTGTVLEGRTFGTAAGSAVGDFIQNQSALAQSANMWITGMISSSNPNETFRSVNSTNNAYSTRFKNNGGDIYFGIENSGGDFFGASPFESVIYSPSNNLFIKTPIAKFTGAATFSSTVTSTGFLLNGNNLTSSLSTNYIPKWNGSSFANSLISDDGNRTYMAKVVQLNDNYQVQWGNSTSMIYGSGANGTINLTGNIRVDNGTTSTSPTTGALVVNGGVGADHVRANNFYGNGSNLTGIQLPITLTTNGTSGAATFSGNVLNVPNYTASGGVNQTQTTVNGSVNGNAICSMPFQTSTYKKVIILLGSFSGSLTYTFPTPFLFSPNIYTGAPGISPATYSITTTSLTLSGGSNTNGWVTLEGF